MLDRVVSSSKLTAIANAIRTKAGTQSSMTLDDMPTAIANIPSGGGTIDLTGYDGGDWAAAIIPHIDTSGMTDMSYMFGDQRTATSIDVSNFNTSNVTNMEGMFNYCQQLTSLDLSSFNTSQVTNMKNMFLNCSSLSSLTLGNNFNTSNVTNMSYMFQNCGGLTSLDLDNWDTSKVTNMANMFATAFYYTGSKMWVPSTFVATSVSAAYYKPFKTGSRSVQVYTDATDATTQGWGDIHSSFTMHYNTTHQDFLNA